MKKKVALALLVFIVNTFDQVNAFSGKRGISAKHHVLLPLGKILNQTGTERSCLPLTLEATKKCMEEYYNNYGFHLNRMPDDSGKFSAAVDKVWRTGKQGVGVVCQNTRKLDACLDRIFDFETCQNPDAYADMMEMSRAAEFYYLDNVRLRFECAHEDVLLATYECMLRAHDNHGAEQYNCTTDFEFDVLFFDVDWCSAAKSLIRCLWMIYENECDSSWKDDSWFTIVCNRIQMPLLLSSDFSQCSPISCNFYLVRQAQKNRSSLQASEKAQEML